MGDPFAPSLLDLAQSHLREIRDAAEGKRLRIKRPYSLVIDVAGMKYADNHERIFERLKIGNALQLLRDSGNAYDANAIAVMNTKGERFGWLPRAFNAAPAALLDRGVELAAKVEDKGIADSGDRYVTICVFEAKSK